MDIDDISVDVPSALTLLEQIVSKLKAAGTLSDELAAELPSRSVYADHVLYCYGSSHREHGQDKTVLSCLVGVCDVN